MVNSRPPDRITCHHGEPSCLHGGLSRLLIFIHTEGKIIAPDGYKMRRALSSNEERYNVATAA